MLPAKELEEEEDDETSKLIRRNQSIQSRSTTGLGDDDDDKFDKFRRTQPWAVGGLSFTALLIITAEFAERCCYYAISSIFVVYMQTMLNYSTSAINAVTSTFNFLGYTFALLGGYIADRYLGRKKTILAFGTIYLLSLVLLTLSASPLGYSNFPYGVTWASWGFILALVLISLGMGGIKANVSVLMAEQTADASSESVESAFRYFYFSINLGSLFGMLVAPLVKRIGPEFPPGNTTVDACSSTNDPYTGYYVAYALFTGVFFFGIIAFLWGYSSYISYPPQGSLLSKCVKIMLEARRQRLKNGGSYFSVPDEGRHWLDWAKIDATPDDAQFADDLKKTLRTVAVFAFQPIYWLLYLQMTNTLVLQATMMYLPGGITPDQMAALDPVFLVILIPIFDSCIFPALRRSNASLNAIQRMTVGYLLAASAMLVAWGLQLAIYNTGTFVDCSGSSTFVISGQGVNVFAQVPVYFFIAISEIFASITSLEFAYSEAPKSMKSIVMAFAVFQTALGSLLGMILTPVVTEPNFGWLFFSFGVAMVGFAIIFYWVFRRYYDTA